MTFSRRDALTLLLGAPLASEACLRRAEPVRGTIRGGALDVGHRLRSSDRAAPAGSLGRTRVAIVGAGASGLSAAWRLRRAGEEDLVVFELEAQPGGTAAYGTDGVTSYPWGAHYLPVPSAHNTGLIELLVEAQAVTRLPTRGGTDPEIAPREAELVREPEERLFVDGRWHEGLFPFAIADKTDLAELERFNRLIDHWANFRDAEGRPAFTLPMRHCSRAPQAMELDKISATTFLDGQGFRSKVLRWYAEYACRDDYGLTLADTSAWALLFYFCARLSEAGGDSAPFLTWPEGNGRLIRHLHAAVGKNLRTSELVTDIVPASTNVEVRTLDARTGQVRRYLADHVILAAPRFVAAKILAPWRASPPAWLDRFTYGSWLVANLHLADRPESVGAEPAWDNVIYDSPSLGYVTATHQVFRDQGPTIWTYYQPLTSGSPAETRRDLALLTHAQCAEAVLADLGRAHPDLRKHLERLDVWRWGHAMVRPVPGLISSEALALGQQPLGRVHFAHSDLSGVALFEEAFDHGVRAAEEVLSSRHGTVTRLGPG